MECTFYQFKRKFQCNECTKKGNINPEAAINRLVGDFQKNRQNSTNNAFRPWYDGSLSGLTLMFKHPPPYKKDIVNTIASTSVYPYSSKESLQEFSPEYIKPQKITSAVDIKHKEPHGSYDSSQSTHDSASCLETSAKRLCSPNSRMLLEQHGRTMEPNDSSNECFSVHDASSQDGTSAKPPSSNSTLKPSTIREKVNDTSNISEFPSSKSKISTDSSSSVSDYKLARIQSNDTSASDTLVPQKSKDSALESDHDKSCDQSCGSKSRSLVQKGSKDQSDMKLSDDKSSDQSCGSEFIIQKGSTFDNNSKDFNSDHNEKCPSKMHLSKEDNTDGKWCTSVSKCMTRNRNSSPLKRLNTREIAEVKKKYHLSNFHRGKWLINGDSCRSLKMSAVWKEVCKMLKCGQLSNCNAKFQETSQEIWIYCDVIYSLDVRKKLKTNCKLNMTTPLTYWIHPHGSILKI